MQKLRVIVDGKTYEVLVELLDGPGSAKAVAAPSAPRAEPVAASAPRPAEPAPPPPPAAGANAITSPLSGKIVSIDVTAGQAITAGVQVATIEAMKMNTFVYAVAPGRVERVHVHPGDAVEEGAPLITLG